MAVTLEQIYNEVKTVREIVTGNGNPESGMVVKQARMDERQHHVMEDLSKLSNNMEMFMQEFRDYAKSTTNRRSSGSKLFGVIPVKIMESIWMWIVRGVIILGLSLFTWICGNSDDVGFILDKAKEMKQTEGIVK